MEASQILQKLTLICRDVFRDDALVLTAETTADDVEEWDSFNHVNVIVAVEMAFGIKFITSEVENLKNIGEFVTTIERKLNNKR
jgi:acyl carrier protein